MHKIVKPGPMVAAPDRDSCKQRRVNLKMQIPPQGFWPGRREGRRGDTRGRRRCGQSPTAGNGRKRAQKSAALPPAALGGNRRNHATHRLQMGLDLCCLACTCESQHCLFFDDSTVIRRCAVVRCRLLFSCDHRLGGGFSWQALRRTSGVVEIILVRNWSVSVGM